MACVVGEIDRRSAGGGHAANLHSVRDNFYVGTIEVRSINPYAKSDWNDTGIEPDFKVQGSRRTKGCAEVSRREAGDERLALLIDVLLIKQRAIRKLTVEIRHSNAAGSSARVILCPSGGSTIWDEE